MKDLVILAADSNIESTLEGLLSRTPSLHIHPIQYKINVYQKRTDPGCYKRAHDFLRPFMKQYHYALVMFDREGCGHENLTREQLETSVEEQLYQSGWKNRAAAIVFDPELEIWVWSDSPHVATILGWKQQYSPLKNWLITQEFLSEDEVKPARPKEAMVAVLKTVSKKRSSKIYRQLAEKVSLERCSDPAFLKLKQTLQSWFSPER